MELNPYSPPESDLEPHNALTIQGSFTTLNFWRKLYIVIIWVIHILLLAILAATMPGTEISSISIMIGLSVFLLGSAYWNHWAIATRNVGHITTLAILNLVPGGNIVGCLIMFSIRSVTVDELKRYRIKRR
ncbi:MAG: hypothetical protein ABW095_11055 [Candidatus Thiodiazotropha sp.]